MTASRSGVRGVGLEGGEGRRPTSGSLRARRRRLALGQWLFASVPLLVISALGVFVFWFVHRGHVAQQKAAFEARVADATAALFSHFAVPLELAFSTPAFLTVEVDATYEDFAHFAAPALQRHPAIAAIEWAPWVPNGERAAFEARGLKIWEPDSIGQPSAAPERSYYFPLLYVVPASPSVVGLDVAFDLPRREMVQHAIESGGAACSPRFQLVEDPPGLYSVAIYAPVFARSAAGEPRGKLRGLAISLFRLQHVVDDALRDLHLDGLAYALLDESNPAQAELLASNQEQGLLPPSELVWARTTNFVDRKWRLEWRALPGAYAVASSAYWVLGLGISLGLAVSGALLAWMLAVRAREEVQEMSKLGNYTLVRRLGEGGMGTVYEAEHAFLRRRTAVKLIRSDMEGGASSERFEREVQYTSQLTHPNTIQIFDYGCTAQGTFFYAMEYLDGVDLKALLDAAGPLPHERAVYLLLQAAGSLAEAHERGMVHRDIKPENIMVCERGGSYDFIKVLDFGLVKSEVVEHESSITHAQAIVGTPEYMAPEALSDPLSTGATADVWALGCVLYFMLTGRPPFSGTNLMATIALVMTAPLPDLDALRSEPVPHELKGILLRCLSKSPSERPQNASELLGLLEDLPFVRSWTQRAARVYWTGPGKALLEMRARRFDLDAARVLEVKLDAKRRRNAPLAS